MDFDTAPCGKRLRLASGVVALHNGLAAAGILITAPLLSEPTAAQIGIASLLVGVTGPGIEPLPVVDLPHAMEIGFTCFTVGHLSVESMAIDRGVDKGGKR